MKMNKYIKYFFGIILFIIFSFTLLAFIFFNTGGVVGDCEISPIEKIFSPTGNSSVNINKIMCGATTKDSISLSISSENSKDDKEFFTIESLDTPKVIWKNDQEIEVLYSRSNKIFLRKENISNISIYYKTK
ncbi:hypothetical protein ACKC9G_15675 [Pokkaliibacter sp. CJK22405]|uniref:hypothetical protein n=1 Tax=Pokkaliibacter sp. CJK22405 TaxID=3384615 RepID=UPI003984D115